MTYRGTVLGVVSVLFILLTLKEGLPVGSQGAGWPSEVKRV